MDSLESLLCGILANKENMEKIGRGTVGNYTVDTCDTPDQGFETAIWEGNHDMVIVERYCDAETAKIGHEKWIEFCEDAPTEVWSVQIDALCDLL